MIHLSEELEAEVRAHAARDYPHECCGVLLGEIGEVRLTQVNYARELGEHTDHKRCRRMERELGMEPLKVVRQLRALPNVHQEGHERRYLIGPEEMFKLERDARAGGFKILGFYHSHPDHPARPSEYDRDWAWPWYTYIITAVERGEPRDMTFWSLNEDRKAFEPEERRKD